MLIRPEVTPLALIGSFRRPSLWRRECKKCDLVSYESGRPSRGSRALCRESRLRRCALRSTWCGVCRQDNRPLAELRISMTMNQMIAEVLMARSGFSCIVAQGEMAVYYARGIKQSRVESRMRTRAAVTNAIFAMYSRSQTKLRDAFASAELGLTNDCRWVVAA